MAPGINGKRSLLTSLQEQGYDENNTLTTLPAMTFTYCELVVAVLSPPTGSTAQA